MQDTFGLPALGLPNGLRYRVQHRCVDPIVAHGLALVRQFTPNQVLTVIVDGLFGLAVVPLMVWAQADFLNWLDGRQVVRLCV